MLTRLYPDTATALYGWLRSKWAAGLAAPSDVAFALGVSLIWLLIYNVRFWELTLGAMWHPGVGAVLFVATLFVLVLGVQAILLLIWPTRWLMRSAASFLFVVAALGSYFCSSYGAVMNKDMMRNVLETDASEVGGLVNPELLLHVLLLGVLPAILIWRVRLPVDGWRRQLKQRAIFIPAVLLISLAGVFASSADYAVFFRAHKPIRFMLSPVAEISSMAGLVTKKGRKQAGVPLIDPAGAVRHVAAPHTKPLVLFLVVGETARAANFQLGGYGRSTNPELSGQQGLVYFQQASSCGTSTAISVPCIFSHLPREQFKVDEAARYTNLLDSLVSAGLDVQWRDNNAGCKGVCARVTTVDYSSANDPALCNGPNCYDDVMLTDLPQKLRTITRDTVIVFHQIGSHGPAYHERYPADFAPFRPACGSNKLQQCSPQEIVNAYDNTLAYTDHFLARQIELLRAAADRIDGMLIYASDHGESLGENGIYLHGMPYSFAPAVQKEVPMLMWVSDGYAERTQLRADCLKAEASLPVSHDNLYHTVLGAVEVRNQVYDGRLDLLSGCRRDAPAGSHE